MKPVPACTPHPVVFVGAGPGSADLITLRGARALEQATVVLYDALTDPALRAHAPDAHWVDVGKRGFGHATAQARINALLVQYAQAGEQVVRLKGGDPSVFGRLEEELAALAEHELSFAVIPGVSAALAAAAASARPLTRRGAGRSVAWSTAMTAQNELKVGRRADTEVFYMASQQLAALGPQLMAAGWPADATVCAVSRAGWPDARVSEHALHDLAQAGSLHAGRPTVVTVGIGAQAVRSAAASPPAPADCGASSITPSLALKF